MKKTPLSSRPGGSGQNKSRQAFVKVRIQLVLLFKDLKYFTFTLYNISECKIFD